MKIHCYILLSLILSLSDAKAKYSERNGVSKKMLSTRELIAERGIMAEEYQVITEDGYILNITRIANNGPVVLLTHGLLNNADDWLTLGNDSLPFALAEAGYDVYLGNTRGNKYVEHVTLSSNDKTFWNFSFHEIGYYDLPAMVDFALAKSKKSKLVYIGHSQGTAVFFVMASMRPEYNKKISLMISMSTIAWFRHAKAPIVALAPFHEQLLDLESKDIYRMLSHDGVLNYFVKRFCTLSKVTMKICTSFAYSTFGFDYSQFNFTTFVEKIKRSIGGTSAKNIIHYAQLINSRNFQLFDYKSGNIEAYGFKDPPFYPVHLITAPVAIMCADNDWLSSIKDVRFLMKKLPNVVDVYRVPSKSFTHNSFIWGRDAQQLVYGKVLSLIGTYGRK